MPDKPTNACPKCAKPVATGERVGSLTSFLFMDMHCQCHISREQTDRAKVVADSQSCKRCGKVIAGPKRKGSFTAFLLKDMRCQCDQPIAATGSGQKSADALKTRFYRPILASDTRRRGHETMRQTRANQLQKSDAQLVTLSTGQIIGGCYQLASLIGQGGMGLVYRASHITLGRTCALKFLAPSMVSRTSWQLFQKEAQIISSLNHPTICHIYDLGIHASSLPFYAMDYLAGRTVDQVITDDGPLSVGATVEIAIKVAEGLSYAHRRAVVHKDIKPANIMLVPNDQGNIDVKLLDFGIAQLSETRSTDSTAISDEVVGSAAYMSPEQFTDGQVDLRSDIYSLGCTIFETLTGVTPFHADDLDELARMHHKVTAPLMSEVTGLEFPLAIEAVVKKCMQKQPQSRYQNANELAIDLQRILDHKPLQFAVDQLASITLANQTVDSTATTRGAAATIGLSILGITGLLLLLAGTVYMVVDYNAKKSIKPDHSDQAKVQSPETKVAGQEALDMSSVNKLSASNGPDYFEQNLLNGVKKVNPSATSDNNAIDPGPGEEFGSVGLVVEQFGKQAMQSPAPMEGFNGSSNSFYKGLQKNSSGITERVYNFGEKLVPGVLTYYKDVTNSDDRGRRFECIGTVKLPATGDVVYALSGELANPEAVLANFNSGDIQGIDAGNTHEHPVKIIKELQRFKGLRYLRLSGFQQGPDTASTVNAMHSLKRLVLIDWHNELKYPLVLSPQIKLIAFEVEYGRGRIDSFFAEPVEQNNIEYFNMVEIPIKREDLLYITRLKRLKTLSLAQVHLDSALFELLGECRALQKLALRDHLLDFNSDKIQILSKLTSLKSVFIECDMANNIQMQKIEHQLKQALPGAQVMVR
ncbi:MAG: serine/threonine protein kinase [Candidatus Obscuribacter sp.]|nr:serine/threonine protein kinase [Candidatus Obscuribacter sp.]MBK9620841.1 serine/threonine protein kinase [Candidatus Obscuribacter sp.]